MVDPNSSKRITGLTYSTHHLCRRCAFDFWNVGGKPYRARLIADPSWSELQTHTEGWVLPQHRIGGLVKKEHLPSSLRKLVDATYKQRENASDTRSKNLAADGSQTMTLHQKRKEHQRRSNNQHGSQSKLSFQRPRTASSSARHLGQTGVSFASTGLLQSTSGLEETCSTLADTQSELPISRMEGMDMTSFSIHEQPTLLPYCSQLTALASRVHDQHGSRYKKGGRRAQSAAGGRSQQQAEPLLSPPPTKVACGGWGAPDPAGVQRAAGERGFMREQGKTWIVAVDEDLTPAEKKSSYKRFHNTQTFYGHPGAKMKRKKKVVLGGQRQKVNPFRAVRDQHR